MLTALLLTVTVLGCRQAAAPPAAAPARPVIRIAGTRLAEALTQALARARPDLEFRHVDGSPIATQDLVRAGDAELGVAFADSVYFAHLGDTDLTTAHGGLRAISALHVAPLLAFVRPASGIRTPADLRGHVARIAPPPREGDARFAGWPVPRRLSGAGTGTVQGITSLPQLVLLSYGILPGEVTNKPVAPLDGIAELKQGTLDAVIAMGFEANVYVATALAQGEHLLEFGGDAIERLRHEYSFIRPVMIPAGTYPGQTAPHRTVGVNMVLVCRGDLDEALAYDLTRLFFAALPRLAADGDLQGIDPQQAPLTPIPLHDGAARYFRETELFR